MRPNGALSNLHQRLCSVDFLRYRAVFSVPYLRKNQIARLSHGNGLGSTVGAMV